MPTSRKISRRQFGRLAGATATGALLAACTSPATPSSIPLTEVPSPAPPTEAPAVIRPRKVIVELDGWAVPPTQKVLDRPPFADFTKQTGIEIEL